MECEKGEQYTRGETVSNGSAVSERNWCTPGRREKAIHYSVLLIVGIAIGVLVAKFTSIDDKVSQYLKPTEPSLGAPQNPPAITTPEPDVIDMLKAELKQVGRVIARTPNVVNKQALAALRNKTKDEVKDYDYSLID